MKSIRFTCPNFTPDPAPAGSLTLAIDSADALHDDLESTIETYKFFVTVLRTLIARKGVYA